jgi:hypothetical protein
MFHQGSVLDHFDFTKEFLEGEPYSFKFGDEEIETPLNTIKTTFTAKQDSYGRSASRSVA